MFSNNHYPKMRFLLSILFLLLLPAIALAQSPSIKSVTYDQFDNLIYKAKGGALFVCIYSSTCPACNKQMPIVNHVGKTYRKNDLKMIVLSTDDSPEQLANYLNSNQLYFEPIWLSQNNAGGLAAILKQYGGNYQNRIPYTAIIDSSGRVTRDWIGVTDYNTYSDWIEKAFDSEEEQSGIPPSEWELSVRKNEVRRPISKFS